MHAADAADDLAPELGPVPPAARAAVRAAARAYGRPPRAWCRAVVLHGSALKGGWVPGGSDVDLRLYLAPGAFDARGALRFDLALAVHREQLAVDPAPFAYVQARVIAADAAPDSAPAAARFAPGSYHVLAGALTAAARSDLGAAELRAEARRTLARVPAVLAGLADRLLDHGAGRLERSVRLAATDVWPTLASALALRAADPAAVWRAPRDVWLDALAPDDPLAEPARAFAAVYRRYYQAARPPALALEATAHAAAALAAAHAAARAAGHIVTPS